MITTSLIAAVVAMPAFADPTAQELLDQKTVTSKYYVDQELATKQDTITIDKVLFYENPKTGENVYVPALVATDAAGTTLNGNTVGVLDFGSMNGSVYGDGLWDSNYNTAAMDSFVPTVRAVAKSLNDINTAIVNFLNFATVEATATNNYSVSFNDTTGNWPSNDLVKFVKGEAFAQGLALKQKKIEAGTAGNVVTYTGTAGQVGSATVSSAATYNGTTLTNGGDIANIAAVETKQDKMTCAGYVSGHENDDNYCWLYSLEEPQAPAPSCLANGEPCGGDHSLCCSGHCSGKGSTCGD